MLSRTERRVVVGVVVAGLLVVTGGVTVFLNRDRITVWFTGDEVVAAQRLAMTAELPSGLQDDPTLSACDSWSALRCAWSDETPERAALLMAGVLVDGDLDVGTVVCGDPPVVPESILPFDAMCLVSVQVALDRMWVATTDRTPVGHVPLGRTAAWVAWDESTMSWPMLELVQGEWASIMSATDAAPTAEEVADALPERFGPLLEGACRSGADGVCLDWEGAVDLSDLGDEAVQALVAELTEAGFFVDAADLDWSSEGVRAHRFLRAPGGLSVSVRMVDGVATGHVLTF